MRFLILALAFTSSLASAKTSVCTVRQCNSSSVDTNCDGQRFNLYGELMKFLEMPESEFKSHDYDQDRNTAMLQILLNGGYTFIGSSSSSSSCTTWTLWRQL